MPIKPKTIHEITKLIKENQLDLAISHLMAISNLAPFIDYKKKIYPLKASFHKNQRNLKKDRIAHKDYALKEKEIRTALLKITSELKGLPEVDEMIQKEYKPANGWLWYQGFEIIIDYSHATEDRIEKKVFRLNEFKNLDDLIEGVYIEMADYFPLESYGAKWVLADALGNPIQYEFFVKKEQENESQLGFELHKIFIPLTTLTVKNITT